MAHCRKKCLSILLTDDCNLKCKYCYCGEERKKNSINVKFVKCAIDDFYKQGNKLFIRFFGNGEPTLEFEKIKEIYEYTIKLDKEATFEIQTNGVFNEEIAKWIGQHIDIVWISYDGTTDVNDFYRATFNNKSVSNIVEKNIKYLNEKVKELGVRATIGKKNLYKQKEIIDKMQEMRVKHIYSDLMFADVNNKLYYEDEINPSEYAKEFLKARKYAEEKQIYYGSFFTINFDEKTNISCRACIPMPHLTVDGYVSCCDMGYADGKLQELIYGKYDEKNNKIIYDNDKIKNIQARTVDNLKQCKDCEIKYYCAGGCIGEAINENGTIFSIKEKNCEAIKFLAKDLLGKKIPVLHP